jgi:CheY-like chemotaxis protein
MKRNLTMLVVDDNHAFRATMASLVEFAGHFPICAANGKEGLDILRKHPVDLIITDILMPEKDGLEFIEQVRDTLPVLPIVAISGGGRVMEKNCCLTIAKFFGASAMISKPFNMAQLLSAIDDAMAHASDESRPHPAQT